MPYFQWRGVDIIGSSKNGKTFARSVEHLDALLFKRQIALISSKQQRQRIVHLPINLAQKAAFFRQLSVLVSAGILLPDALTIVSEQIDNRELQEIVHTMSLAVQEGFSLSSALAQYPNLFDAVTVQLVQAGEDAGNLPQALNALCEHLQTAHEFYARLRAALLLPLLTVLFFVFIALVIFVAVIPRFQDLFTSLRAPVPSFTKFLLRVSVFIRSWRFPVLLAGITVCVGAAWAMRKQYSQWWAAVVLRLPFVGPIYRNRFIAYLFESTSLLLAGGVRLVPALSIVKSSLRNSALQEYVTLIEQEVLSGHSLSDAVQAHCDELCSPDVIAMIQVGEQSGRLPFMLASAAQVYHEQVRKDLSYITMLAQPVLMIILGLLVTALIFSIYIPILHISQVTH